MRPIQYEPHPVSAERKAEIIAAGFRIIDAKFKPKDEPKAVEPVGEVVPVTAWTPLDVASSPASEIKAALAAKGVKFRANASRDTLLALLFKED